MSETNEAVISTDEGTESTTAAETQETKVVSVEEFESLKSMFEKVQATQKGVDRTNTELRKQLEESKKQIEEQKKNLMSPEEKLEYERQIRESEKSMTEKELAEAKRQVLVKDFLLEKGLDKKFEKYLKGSTFEDLENESTELLTGIDELVEKKIKSLHSNTTTPTTGEPANTQQPSKRFGKDPMETLKIATEKAAIK